MVTLGSLQGKCLSRRSRSLGWIASCPSNWWPGPSRRTHGETRSLTLLGRLDPSVNPMNYVRLLTASAAARVVAFRRGCVGEALTADQSEERRMNVLHKLA